ncbi:MAG: helix-turn-helix transcriptional regulator [Candidatus Freyarchaeota archaeon]|nr:helix-turn-helix transcriptional regulator [Candidatus Jordarchaeia archaeon]
MKTLMDLDKAKTRLDVLNAVLDYGPVSPSELAERLGLSQNAVNIALHYLSKSGVVRKVERGLYEANYAVFCKAFLALAFRLRDVIGR